MFLCEAQLIADRVRSYAMPGSSVQGNFMS